MSSTNAPPRAWGLPSDRADPSAEPGRAAAQIGLVEGTELVGEFRSSGYREPSRLVGRADGRIVRLAPVLYSVVTSLDRHAHRRPTGREELLAQVATEVRNETGLDLNADHIAYLLDRKLAPLGITTDSRGEHPTIAKSDTFLSLPLIHRRSGL